MTNKEIENRIKNLEIALSSLASKTHNRDAKAESDISEVDGKADSNTYAIEDVNEICADIFLQICEEDLGLLE